MELDSFMLPAYFACNRHSFQNEEEVLNATGADSMGAHVWSYMKLKMLVYTYKCKMK
jgi:hypothetical protein